jgi:hypothetical protein
MANNYPFDSRIVMKLCQIRIPVTWNFFQLTIRHCGHNDSIIWGIKKRNDAVPPCWTWTPWSPKSFLIFDFFAIFYTLRFWNSNKHVYICTKFVNINKYFTIYLPQQGDGWSRLCRLRLRTTSFLLRLLIFHDCIVLCFCSLITILCAAECISPVIRFVHPWVLCAAPIGRSGMVGNADLEETLEAALLQIWMVLLLWGQ